MSRRHEDNKPPRGKPAPRKPSPGKPPSGKPSTGKPSTRKPAPRKPAPRKPSPGKPSALRPDLRPKPDAPAKPGPRAPRTSKRRQLGLVVTPKGGPETKDGKVRLNQFLAQCGICSRRAADELIERGRVEVNGTIVRELGVRVDPVQDEVLYNGSRVQPEKPVYVLFNKPAGVVCTNAKHEQKKRVIDFMPTVRGRLFTVGRLDLDSEGLILLTNDGPFALEMTHPRYGVPKLYNVVLRGRVSQEELSKARGGVWLSEGPTAGMRVRVSRTGSDRTFLKVLLREGKNREIRRVFAQLGYPVLTLKRIRIGELSLHGLKTGEWRFLHLNEVQDLRRVAAGEDLPAEDNE